MTTRRDFLASLGIGLLVPRLYHTPPATEWYVPEVKDLVAVAPPSGMHKASLWLVRGEEHIFLGEGEVTLDTNTVPISLQSTPIRSGDRVRLVIHGENQHHKQVLEDVAWETQFLAEGEIVHGTATLKL